MYKKKEFTHNMFTFDVFLHKDSLYKNSDLWYVIYGAVNTGRRVSLSIGGNYLPPDIQKGGLTMVTYPDLIQIGILIVGIIGLFIAADRKKK